MFGSILGTIGKDAEMKALPNGTPILEFSVVENAWVGSEKSTWYRCALFGKRGEKLESMLLKGAKVAVVGQSYMDEYTNNDNDTVKTLKCKVTDVVIQKYADSEGGGQSRPPSDYGSHDAPPSRPAGGPPPASGPGSFEDDIPF